MNFRLEFDDDLEYDSRGPDMLRGPALGYGNPEGFRIDGGMVVIEFGNGIFHKVPERRLRRVVEW